MIVVTSTDVWADSNGVQRAIVEFHGRHVGFGDFILPHNEVGPGRVVFIRRDNWEDGEAMRKRYKFSGRPHVLDGLPESVNIVVSRLEATGHSVIYEEKE